MVQKQSDPAEGQQVRQHPAGVQDRPQLSAPPVIDTELADADASDRWPRPIRAAIIVGSGLAIWGLVAWTFW